MCVNTRKGNKDVKSTIRINLAKHLRESKHKHLWFWRERKGHRAMYQKTGAKAKANVLLLSV